MENCYYQKMNFVVNDNSMMYFDELAFTIPANTTDAEIRLSVYSPEVERKATIESSVANILYYTGTLAKKFDVLCNNGGSGGYLYKVTTGEEPTVITIKGLSYLKTFGLLRSTFSFPRNINIKNLARPHMTDGLYFINTNSNIYGTFEDLANMPNCETIRLELANVSGSIESFVEAQIFNGKTNGNFTAIKGNITWHGISLSNTTSLSWSKTNPTDAYYKVYVASQYLADYYQNNPIDSRWDYK